ncbi:MAG TPA: M28 family metallopeptidase [Bryobacteraceae bacterium]|jgi:Zn-dependent M28 family amino/carboxypeptidase|nr:M28 family metallopeptidase [Bryobacteraceae bacterium]
MRNRFLAVLAAAAALAANIDYTAEGQRWWSHVEALAADDMQGRNTGSEGYQKAADYVRRQFERAGLKPAGANGYFQPMKFDVAQIVEDQSSVALVRDGKAAPLKLGEDAVISLRSDLAPSVEGPLVFVGYGVAIPEAHHNDLSGLDLKGKIAVYLAGGPRSASSELRAHYSSLGERWAALRKAGATGLVSIQNPKHMDVPWARSSLARLQPSMRLADPALNDARGLRFSLTFNPDRAEKLFEGSGHSFRELLALADAGQPLPRFALPASLVAKVSVKRWQVDSMNVVGVREGSDPKLKNEYVVLSAHLDHLGVGQPIGGDRIYNGAMDDASGVASLIDIAQQLQQGRARLKRSALFLAVTGEEKGLQGSRYFAAHPSVDAASLVADINLDMYLPLFPLRWLEVQGVNESTLGDEIRAAARDYGVEVQADKEPDRNLFIRSDQYSFVRRGVPALAFKFGYKPGTPEEKTAKEWLRNRYHAPSDDLKQPVDKAAAAKFNRILLDLVRRVANSEQRPQWHRESFFRRFAAGT